MRLITICPVQPVKQIAYVSTTLYSIAQTLVQRLLAQTIHLIVSVIVDTAQFSHIMIPIKEILLSRVTKTPHNTH